MNLFYITVEQANATMRGGIEMTVDVFVLCCLITNTKTTLWSVQNGKSQFILRPRS